MKTGERPVCHAFLRFLGPGSSACRLAHRIMLNRSVNSRSESSFAIIASGAPGLGDCPFQLLDRNRLGCKHGRRKTRNEQPNKFSHRTLSDCTAPSGFLDEKQDCPAFLLCSELSEEYAGDDRGAGIPVMVIEKLGQPELNMAIYRVPEIFPVREIV